MALKSIEAYDLVRNLNGFTAVENLNFSVEEGEIFGLLGSNGAGDVRDACLLFCTLLPPHPSDE